MYSLFHDLTHNSLFESRAANAPLGSPARLPAVHALPLVAAPAQPPPREHRQPRPARARRDLHDDRSPSTKPRPRARRLGYRAYRNPLLMLFVGPSLVFLFERRFPQRGMSRPDPRERRGHKRGARGLGDRLERARRLADASLLIQGTTLVAGGAMAAWLLYIQHQYEDTYYQAAGRVDVRAARRCRGAPTSSSRARSRGWSATPTTTTYTTSARGSRTTASAPPTRSSRSLPHTPVVTVRGSVARAASEAVGRGARVPGAFPGAPRALDRGARAGRDRTLAAS